MIEVHKESPFIYPLRALYRSTALPVRLLTRRGQTTGSQITIGCWPLAIG